jgi:hypothetical protein
MRSGETTSRKNLKKPVKGVSCNQCPKTYEDCEELNKIKQIENFKNPDIIKHQEIRRWEGNPVEGVSCNVCPKTYEACEELDRI